MRQLPSALTWMMSPGLTKTSLSVHSSFGASTGKLSVRMVFTAETIFAARTSTASMSCSWTPARYAPRLPSSFFSPLLWFSM